MKGLRIATIAVFLLILFILSVSLLAGGSTQFNRRTIPYTLPLRNCTLSGFRTVSPSSEGDGWIGVWGGGDVIDDIFSVQPTRELAMASIYRQNDTYPCLCDRSRCYLNIQSTRYVQTTDAVFKYGSDAMIAIGSLLLVFLIGFGVAMYRNRKEIYVYTLHD